MVKFTVSNNTYNYLNWTGFAENSTGWRKKSCAVAVPNFDPCIHKEVRAKLSVDVDLNVANSLPCNALSRHNKQWCLEVLSQIETLLPAVLIKRENTVQCVLLFLLFFVPTIPSASLICCSCMCYNNLCHPFSCSKLVPFHRSFTLFT